MLTSWFTPTSLFLFLNLVIGTIAVISRFSSNRQPREELRPLHRAPSLIDRVKSINLSLYKFNSHETTMHFVHNDNTGEHYPPPLERAPSLLERVKSIKFGPFYQPEPESEFSGQDSELDHRATASESENWVAPAREQGSNDVPERAPSFLERVKSIKFPSFHKLEPGTEFSGEERGGYSEMDHHVTRSKSESTAAPERKGKVAEKMKKSASEKGIVDEEEDRERVEKRRPVTMRLEKTARFAGEDDGVDAKADDFINRFKKQLQLQRWDSLLRYRDMLKGN